MTERQSDLLYIFSPVMNVVPIIITHVEYQKLRLKIKRFKLHNIPLLI